VNIISTGLDNLLAKSGSLLKGKRIGLVVNHTSLASDHRLSIEHFQKNNDCELKIIFAPEHGLYGVDQDMATIENETDSSSGLLAVSLYGKDHQSLTPDIDKLKDIDAMVFDIQDIGSRYYTFIYTLANCMQACGDAGVEIIVCDRPNPINGTQVEGNLVKEGFHSFVGQYSLPNRHGMTVGELANFFRDHIKIKCDLTVVPMTGWKREMWFDQTGQLWTPTSPNMPTLLAAVVYPGMCMIEGTLLSEGRGTALPFEQCGAPGIDPHILAKILNKQRLPGVLFRPQFFKPVFQKWAGKTCGGIQLHVTDRNSFKPVLTGVAIIRTIAKHFPDAFQWRTEPYEFVSDRPAIDLLYGNSDLREKLMTNEITHAEIESTWGEDLEKFQLIRKEYLIY
jgi:uncharacterized protein YbbC (DUF1343 family)